MKAHQDFGTANFNQAIIETMLDLHYYQDHLSKIRTYYKAKAQLMLELLEKTKLKDAGWTWEQPEGGLLMWLKGPQGIDCSLTSVFCQKCITEKVLYVPGDLCFGDKPDLNYVRLAYGAISADDMPEAVRRFANAANACKTSIAPVA